MRFLLDENVPVQLLEALRCVLPAHGVDHVDTLGWKGKQDRFLLPDAAAAGYDALLTIDRRRLDDPTELRAIRSSGLHHITFPPPSPASPPSSAASTANDSSASAASPRPGVTR